MARSIEDTIRDAGVTDADAAIANRFSGYLGNSGVDTRTRLYLNEQLNEYIEVATADVIKTIDLGGENSPIVVILTRSQAIIQHTAIVSERVQADFLAGEIAKRNLQDDRPLWAAESGPAAFITGPTNSCGSIGSCEPRPQGGYGPRL